MKQAVAPYYLLNDAYRAFRKKRYKEAYIILEEATASKPNHPYPYFLLAVIYLFAGRLASAEKVLSSIETEYSGYMPAVHLRAFLAMKAAGSFDEALAFYVSQIKLYPDDIVLKQGAGLIRASGSFSELQKTARLQSFVSVSSPPRELNDNRLWEKNFVKKSPVYRQPKADRGFFKAIAGRKAFIVSGAVCAAALAAVFLLNVKSEKQKSHAIARVLDETELSGPSAGLINVINKKKPAHFYASTEKLSADFNAAKRLIKAGNSNEAVLLLNKIAESNASFQVKEKVAFLLSFVINMEDREYESLSFKNLADKPYLYRGYAVEWTGRAANLKERDGSCSFTLLVDYSNEIFSGTADVFYESPEPRFANGDRVIVKGVFVVAAAGGSMYVKAHQVKKY